MNRASIIVIGGGHAGIEAANAGYNGPDYQAALDALDGSASREFRYVEATY